VKSGENLASIAQKYGCSVDNLKAWNNLKDNTIYPKQKLRVTGETTLAQAPASAPAQAPDKTPASNENKYLYYTVKKGDTLWDIAQQYKGVSVDDIKKWNNLGSSSRLQVGQKLKIGRNG
jgi:membrane-bound lytic murein transglycosylase D